MVLLLCGIVGCDPAKGTCVEPSPATGREECNLGDEKHCKGTFYELEGPDAVQTYLSKCQSLGFKACRGGRLPCERDVK
jgi:hypothetical protein